jgi:branched-chain amino acid transport system substrate-binding protein
MSRRSLYLSRRRFLQTTAIGAASLAAPSVLRAQGAAVKVGVLHPVSGALSYSGQQGRIGAEMAIEEINAAGGIKSMGGAKIEPMLGEDERRRRRRDRRRLRQRDLPVGEPDRGAL